MREKIKDVVYSISRNTVSLSELELDCLVDILTSRDNLITAFLGTFRDRKGLFIITNLQVIYISRPSNMKDFVCLYYPYSSFVSLYKYDTGESIDSWLIEVIMKDGTLFEINRLSEERANNFYQMFIEMSGVQPIGKQNKGCLVKPLKIIGGSAFVLLLFFFIVGVLVDDTEEDGRNETPVSVEIDDSEPSQPDPSPKQTTVNKSISEEESVELDGVMLFQLEEYFYTDNLTPPNGDFAWYLNEDELFTYLVVIATVKNISNEDLNLAYENPLQVTLTLDEVYDYYPFVDVLSEDGSEFSYSLELAPNDISTAYYSFRVPRKSENSDQSLVLDFEKLNEDYTADYITSIQLR